MPQDWTLSVLDFEVKRCTRVCAKTDRALQPGDVFYSYLTRDGGETVRIDVAADAWEGPPEDCVGWWKSNVPDLKSKKMNWAPDDVMLHYFAETEGCDDQADIRYILALLMVRRRIFRLEESETLDGQEMLVLFCGKNNTEYRVSVEPISAARSQEVQELLAQLLVDAGSK